MNKPPLTEGKWKGGNGYVAPPPNSNLKPIAPPPPPMPIIKDHTNLDK